LCSLGERRNRAQITRGKKIKKKRTGHFCGPKTAGGGDTIARRGVKVPKQEEKKREW